MDERDSKGGRIDRKIELGMRYVEEGIEHTRNTSDSPTKENKFISQKQHLCLSYNFPFYRVKRIERLE